MSRLLVVNDEPAHGRALQEALSLEGFDVVLATRDEEPLEVVEDGNPDAVIVDVAPRSTRGVELCERVRAIEPGVPLLVLGSSDPTIEQTAGLSAGADEFISRPFVLVELLTRLRALLRRKARPEAAVLRFNDLVLDPGTRRVVRAGRPFELTVTQFRLLELFLMHPREVLPRATISMDVWGFDFGSSSNSLNVHIGHLRRKLEARGEPRLIHTVRGVGYVLRT